MSKIDDLSNHGMIDAAPGDQDRSGNEIATGIRSYLIGLGLSALLTALSFLLAATTLVWAPGIPVALIVFVIAQMGVRPFFFCTSRRRPITRTMPWRSPSAC